MWLNSSFVLKSLDPKRGRISDRIASIEWRRRGCNQGRRHSSSYRETSCLPVSLSRNWAIGSRFQFGSCDWWGDAWESRRSFAYDDGERCSRSTTSSTTWNLSAHDALFTCTTCSAPGNCPEALHLYHPLTEVRCPLRGMFGQPPLLLDSGLTCAIAQGHEVQQPQGRFSLYEAHLGAQTGRYRSLSNSIPKT